MNDENIEVNSRQVEVYSAEDYRRDEEKFTIAEKENKIDYSSFKRLMVHDLCLNSEIIQSGYIGRVKLEDVQRAMDYPQLGWRTLMIAAEQLMRISPHFYRLNTLYSNMALFCWGIDLYDVKENANRQQIKKQYGVLAGKLENMHLKHEFSKIMKVLPYQDVYCGLVVESSADFFFQKIDYRICELFQVQDGLYNFKIKLPSINVKELNAYPDYVQKAYIDHIEGKNPSIWYAPPADKQICIKLNSQWIYPYPILISLIRDILDLDVYKKLKLQSARTDNYKAIMMEVPIDKETVDKPLLSPETLGVFAQINRESMSDDIGMIHTLGSKGEAISFKDSANTRNNVQDAIDEIYNSAGESKELFNGSSSGTAVTLSVENDSAFVYGIYRQLERWMNRYIKLRKYNKPNFKFLFYLLDTTIFNRDNVSKRYKDAATLGVGIDKWIASLEITPSRQLGANILNKEVFDFQNNLIPLSSSYNGVAGNESPNSNGESGRPKKSEEGELLSEEGEKTEDGEKNDR